MKSTADRSRNSLSSLGRQRRKVEPARAGMPSNALKNRRHGIEVREARPTSVSATTQARPPCRKPSNWRSGSRNVGSKGNGAGATTSGTADSNKMDAKESELSF